MKIANQPPATYSRNNLFPPNHSCFSELNINILHTNVFLILSILTMTNMNINFYERF